MTVRAARASPAATHPPAVAKTIYCIFLVFWFSLSSDRNMLFEFSGFVSPSMSCVMLHAFFPDDVQTSSSSCSVYPAFEGFTKYTCVRYCRNCFCRFGHQQCEQRVHSHTKSHNPEKFDSSAIFCVESIFEVKTFIARVPTELCNFPHFVPKNSVFQR